MRLFSAAQMRAADAAAAAAGMPTILLMEAAGRAVAETARDRFPAARSFLVLCGRGNNGGDGYVAARFLRASGHTVTVLEMTSGPAGDDAPAARRALLAHGGAPEPLDDGRLAAALERCDVVIDALLGSGLDRPLHGDLQTWVERVTASAVPVLAVDVPTGVSADAPTPPGPHLRATATVQLAGAKRASVFYPARSAFGDAVVVDIGIPRRILEDASPVTLLDAAAAARWLPTRRPEAHKYTAGTVLVVAGSLRFLGAAELACRAAYRGGAGLVTLAASSRAPSAWPEVVFAPLDWGAASPLDALEDIEARRAQTAVVGPGLDPAAVPWLPRLLAQLRGTVVLDAGALAEGAELREAVRAHGRVVLTPHVGEAARLLETSPGEVLEDPLAAAATLAERFAAVAVLKGPSTVVAAPDGRMAVSTRGHPGMATGGTGDVLAGLLGALLADGDMFERACAGVYVHGRAGERAAVERGVGLVADDVVEALTRAVAELAC